MMVGFIRTNRNTTAKSAIRIESKFQAYGTSCNSRWRFASKMQDKEHLNGNTLLTESLRYSYL
jgi:hypothetical protein